MWEETGQVVDEDEEEDWAQDGPLSYPVGKGKEGGPATHSLLAISQVAAEPVYRQNSAPS